MPRAVGPARAVLFSLSKHSEKPDNPYVSPGWGILFQLSAFASLLAAGGLVRADTQPTLTQPEMQELLRALRKDYAQPAAVNYEALNRAAIEGLLRQNPQTMQLVLRSVDAPVPPLVVESLTPRIAAVRPGALRPGDASALRTALTKLASGETSALILDLRAVALDSDPAAAADFAALFVAKDTPLPGGVNSAAVPAWTRELIVLVDSDTTNTGEVLAAVLQSSRRALLAGYPTRGRTAVVTELPLRKSDEGQLVLRYTAQRVVFPDGVPDPFGKGLSPDLPAALDPGAKQKVFELQTSEGLARGVFAPARPRSNEASLIAKTNPEIPDRIARTAGQPSELENQPLDRPLQLAVDVLIAHQTLTAAAPE
jgi:hypothetical protein